MGLFSLQTALSAFFQETNIPYSHHHHQMVSVPCSPRGIPAGLYQLGVGDSRPGLRKEPLGGTSGSRAAGGVGLPTWASLCSPVSSGLGDHPGVGCTGEGALLEGALTPLLPPQMCTPANTPATPPNFPDALTMFSRLKASESFHSGGSGSPMAATATSPPPHFPLTATGSFAAPGWPAAASPPGGAQHHQPPQPPLWTPAPPSPASDWPPLAPQQAASEPRAHPAMEAER